MAEQKPDETVPAPSQANGYETPEVEEVVTRDGIEREVAYAGQPSQIIG